jgi:TonB family protein
VEGQVRDAKVTKSLEPSLDEQAIRAVNNWKFQPGKKDGVPVAVQLMTEVSFHLY